MTTPKTSIDAKLITLIKQQGSITAYRGSKLLDVKYDTVKYHLNSLVKRGTLYTRDVGKSTHYAIAPIGVKSEYKKSQPDIKKSEQKTEGYGRASVSIPVTRANSPSEVIRERGFVCHPNVKGNQITSDFIRCHHNGEYQLKILKKGKMVEGTHFIPIPNTDRTITVRWNYSPLNVGQTNCHCHIKLPYDATEYALRTVSTVSGEINLMSIWVHPRYIYNVGVVDTAYAEFEQQVRDLIPILKSDGWEFDDTVISMKGDHHYAFNDRSLGSLVKSYERKDGCPIEFDHSHGVNEMEVIGDNENLIECIANLPKIVSDISMALKETTIALSELGKQVSILSKMQVDALTISNYSERPFDNGGNMYG